MDGGVLSLMVTIWLHVETLPQESAMEYLLVITLGHVPDDDWFARENVEATSPQLSVAEPPAVVNADRLAKTAGTSAKHCTVVAVGQVSTGAVLSLTV